MFTVAEGVEWLRRTKQVATPEAALTMLGDMQVRRSEVSCSGSGDVQIRAMPRVRETLVWA